MEPTFRKVRKSYTRLITNHIRWVGENIIFYHHLVSTLLVNKYNDYIKAIRKYLIEIIFMETLDCSIKKVSSAQ